MAERGLLGGVILGATLTAGALGAIMLFRHFGVSPVGHRVANAYSGAFANPYASSRYDMTYPPSVGGSPNRYISNTLPVQTPGMLEDSPDYIQRRIRTSLWHS